MSFQMQIAVQFALWFIAKQKTQPDDVLDVNEAWTEFMATEEAIECSKTVISQIIPQVVEKMPVQKKAAPRPRKTKSNASSQTGEETTSASEDPSVPQEPVAEKTATEKKPKKVAKKKATEPSEAVEKMEESVVEKTEEPVVEKKPKKVAKKKATEPESVSQPQEPVLEKKSKKTKITEEPAVEVVVPKVEVEQLTQSPNYEVEGEFEGNDLSEEPYEQETEFEEVYVNEVLCYVDSNDNWLDSQQNPIAKPANL